MAKLLPILAIVVGAVATFYLGPLGGMLVSMAFSLVSSAMAPKPKKSDFNLASQARDVTVTVRSSVAPRRVIYGEARMSGPLVFADVTNRSSGGYTKRYLHMIVPLAAHEIEAVGWGSTTVPGVIFIDSYIWYNGADARYKLLVDGAGDTAGTTNAGPLFVVNAHLGADDQAADSTLIAKDSKWTNAHRLRGVAYLYVSLREDPGVWTTGIPNISAIVRGKKVYDPRAATVSITSSSVANPGVFTTGAVHGLSVGNRIFIDSHASASPTIAKEFVVASVPTTTTFSVLGNDGSGSIGDSLPITTGGTGGTLSVMKWSDNAALVILDYLVAPFGFNCALSEIDASAFIAAANICEEMVTLTDSSDTFTADASSDVCPRPTLSVPIRRGDGVQLTTTGTLPAGLSLATTYYYIASAPTISNTAADAGQISGFNFKLATSLANARAGTAIDITDAGTGVHTITRKSQPRYTANGAVTLDQAPIEVVKMLLSSCGGILTYTQGEFRLMAAASVAATVTLDEDDLRGGISLRSKTERKELFNTVRGTFIDPDNNFQATDFPQITSAALKTDDGGEEITRDIELPFENDATRAQRLAKITLLRARTGGQIISFPAKLTALRIAPQDTVGVTIAKLGLSASTFIVTDWRFSDDLGIDLTLSAVAAADYSWTASEAATATKPATLSLVDASYSPPPTMTLSQDTIATASGDSVTRLIVTLTAPNDVVISGYEVEYKISTATYYTLVGSGTQTIYTVTGVTMGATYNVRARAINSMLAYSEYVSGTRVMDDAAVAPADVTAFSVNVISGTAHLSWASVADSDLSHYRLRYSTATSGATWAGSVDLVPRIGRPATSVHVPALTGTYLIKAVDFGGNESANATSSISGIADVSGFNAVETVTESSTFTGTKSDVIVNASNLLTLDRGPHWDSLTGNWDALTTNWDASSPTVVASGVYSFAGTVDLTAVYTSRVTASLTVETIYYSALWDLLIGNWDQLDGNWDSLSPAKNVGATIEIRTTNDNPAGAPTWSAWRAFVVGDYTARAFEFRLTLTSSATDAAPGVSALSVTVDMPDRVTAGASLTLTGGALPVSFAPAFKAVPKIVVTMKDMATGDYIAVLNEAATGFNISAFNAVGARVARNFDYMAKGYGEVA